MEQWRQSAQKLSNARTAAFWEGVDADNFLGSNEDGTRGCARPNASVQRAGNFHRAPWPICNREAEPVQLDDGADQAKTEA
jgi:hypothetical protein